MKLNIFRESEQEKELTLALIQTTSGAIRLTAVDQYGIGIEGGHILSITTEGTLFTPCHCKAPGIETDVDGCIRKP